MDHDRTAIMDHIASEIQALVDWVTEEEIKITYLKMTDEEMTRFDEWSMHKFHLVKGDEHFLITKFGIPLYMVNVTADSYLTAIKELMDKIAAKF